MTSDSQQTGVTALELVELSAGYGGPPVADGVSLIVAVGETVCLLGANGAGKTTIVNCSAGIVRRYGGRVILGSDDVTAWPVDRKARSGLVLVPEGRRLFARMSVEANLRLAWSVCRADRREALPEALQNAFDRFPILGKRRAQLAGTLSGGEQQMLAIARAIIQHPKMLVLDEPSMGLAPKIVEEIFEAIGMLAREQSCGVLVVEQNAAVALRQSDRGYVLERGRIVFTGNARDLARNDAIRAAYLGSSARKAESASESGGDGDGG